METVRLFEAFAGYGSQLMALRRLEKKYPDKIKVEPVGISEIDKYAIQAYKAVHGEVKNYGDISKIDWNEVPDFDLFTYSSPCFAKGTLVTTEKGLKRIEEITGEERVLTHTNSFRDVVKPMVRKYVGEMYNIKAMCFDNLDCTPEHPFYVREDIGIKTFDEPRWVLAKDLTKNHYLGVAINTESKLPEWNYSAEHSDVQSNLTELFSNKSFWYLMGRYIVCGCKEQFTDNSFGVLFFCRRKKLEKLVSSIKECGFKYTVTRVNTLVYKVQLYSNELHDFVSRYGDRSDSKRIDGETLNLPAMYLRPFLEGIASDRWAKLNFYQTTTESRELAYGIGQCVTKAYRVPYLLENNDSHVVSWSSGKTPHDIAFYENGYIWCPIYSIQTFRADCFVYNMEVSVDNSYTANGCIVHNCQDFSQAGKQQGGEEGSGTRSSLLWECQKVITIKRPKYCLLENVSALVSEKFMPLFFRWFKVLEDLGYKSYWKVLNAKDYGVPQNRERVFLLSIREDAKFPYYFPKPMKLEKQLKDVLEDNVDEKFYLKDVRIAGFNGRSISEHQWGFVHKKEEVSRAIVRSDYKDAPKLLDTSNENSSET